MKRMISFIIVFVIVISASLNAFAGSIDVDIAYYDDALLFVGKIDDYKIICREEDYPDTEYSLTVIPVSKIKGDVIIDKPMDFQKVRTGKLELKAQEYLFGYLKNQLYIWELDNYRNLPEWEKDEYTENSIILKERHNDTVSQGIQSFLNDGVYELAEKERLDIGNKKTFASFVGENLYDADKIVFHILNEHHIVDKEQFMHLANEILITNVKNDILKSTNYEHILYVSAEGKDGTVIADMFAAVAPYGEVDKLSLGMSRLFSDDYRMEQNDVEKLYSLLPDDVQKRIPEFHKMLDEGDKPVTVVNKTLVIFVIVFILLLTLVMLLLRKRK